MSPSRLQNALLDWPAWCRRQPRVVRQLKGGRTNDSYLLQAGHRHYVLRINSSSSDALDLDRSAEISAFNTAAKAGIGAQLVYCDPRQHYLVTRYIAGRQWRSTDLCVDGGVERLASLVRAIHHLEPVGKVLDIRHKAENYWAHLPQNATLAEQLSALRPQVEVHIAAAEQHNSGLLLCHNDLLAENLIVGDKARLYAIDWEYAALGDPYFDLAVIVEEHGLDNRLIERLLSAYHGSDRLADYNRRLYHHRVIYCYVTLLWYGVKYSRQPDADIEQACNGRLVYLQRLLADRAEF